MVNISDAKLHDSKGLKQLVFARDTIIVKDRAYFEFDLMMQRIRADKTFVTRIKGNTLFETTKELELPAFKYQEILKDEIIQLSGKKAIETGIDQQQLRLVHVFKADENRVIEIVTNNIDLSAGTIADL